jgi:hypothetical protein
MIIQIILENDLGKYCSEKMEITKEQYKELIEVSKNFYSDNNGFELWIENGFMVFPPEIVKKSILTLNILEEDNEDEK